jgi:hypothetical protein
LGDHVAVGGFSLVRRMSFEKREDRLIADR